MQKDQFPGILYTSSRKNCVLSKIRVWQNWKLHNAQNHYLSENPISSKILCSVLLPSGFLLFLLRSSFLKPFSAQPLKHKKKCAELQAQWFYLNFLSRFPDWKLANRKLDQCLNFQNQNPGLFDGIFSFVCSVCTIH